jgi:type II secretory pathway pseudopilin PulG
MTPAFAARLREERGYAMVALLVALSIMGVMLSVALPAWHTAARREREAELAFRGEQYARAIRLFQQRYTNTSPPSVDVLVSERFLRKKYKDPITGGEFELLTAGSVVEGTTTPPGMQGRSTSSGSQTRSGGIDSNPGSNPGSSTGSSTGTSTGSSTSTLTAFLGGRGSTAGRGATTQQSGTGATGQTGRGGVQVQRAPLQLIMGGNTAGIMGVRSKSTEKSLRVYRGAEHYNEWIFQNIQAGRVGGTGTRAPGAGTGRGQQTPGGGRSTTPQTPQTPSPFGRGVAAPAGSGARGRGF